MRWLIIVLLVSLLAMLLAAAGVALHIWLQHLKLRRQSATGAERAFDQADETDQDQEN